MATENIEIKLCDLCGKNTNNFHYWETKNSSLGVLSESSLVIDICEECCSKIYLDIPSNMMIFRGEDFLTTDVEIENQIKIWKDVLEE